MTDPYIYAIAALLPVTAGMLISQPNPYNALILRGILGAVAALIYAILGAADVALTEALMGTLLAISLYAVAVRSSMVMRLGVLEPSTEMAHDRTFNQLVADLRTILAKRYLRLELVAYGDSQALQQALSDRAVHTTISPAPPQTSHDMGTHPLETMHSYQTVTRIQRLYEIMQPELPSGMSLIYVNALDSATSTSEQHP